MIKVYKKWEKSIDNPWGIIELDNFTNYDRPFLLCISSQININKSVFGLIKEGARAARVRTTDEYASGFDITKIGIDFLGLKNDINDNRNFDLVDDFLYPFLKRGSDIKKQARKMNFFTYCNATLLYVEIESKLKEKLLEDGYLEEEIKEILSQISLISIASEVNISKVNASAILFKDVNDLEVKDYISRTSLNKMSSLSRETYIAFLRNNGPLVFAFNGIGEHSLKEYFRDDNIVKSALCASVSYILDNSIQNIFNEELIPLLPRKILQVLLKYNAEFEDSTILFKRLSEEITYHETPRFTKEEDRLLRKLDEVYLHLAKTEMLLSREKEESKKNLDDKKILISEIKDKCSDVAFNQIVVANGMWNNAIINDDYRQMKTDREIREEYEKSLTSNSKLK